MRETHSRRAPHGDGGGPKIVVVSTSVGAAGHSVDVGIFSSRRWVKSIQRTKAYGDCGAIRFLFAGVPWQWFK